jgi:hypothetical protein
LAVVGLLPFVDPLLRGLEVLGRPGPTLAVRGPATGGAPLCGTWQRTSGLGTADLGFGAAARAIAVLAPDDAWAAVAYHRHQNPAEPSFDFNEYRALVHWDGQAWTNSPYPRPAGRYLTLAGLYAAARPAVWAVGSAGDLPPRPLILRWDGTQWRQDALPLPGALTGQLLAVDGTGPADVWAVGGQVDLDRPGSPAQPLALHWDGMEWTVSPIAEALGPTITLTAVWAGDPANTWVVGYEGSPFTWYAESQTPVAARWDGRRWQRVPVPEPATAVCPADAPTRLTAVAGTGPHDVWAVGYCTAGATTLEFDTVFPSRGVAYRWDGRAWTDVALPNPYASQTFYGLTAEPTGAVWVVGQEDVLSRRNFNELYVAGGRPLVLRWDGAGWAEVPSIRPYPKVDAYAGTQGFAAVDRGPDGSIWAVGHAGDSVFLGFEALLEVFQPCGP